MGHPASEVNNGGLNVMYTLLNVNYHEQAKKVLGSLGYSHPDPLGTPSEFAGQEQSTTKLTKSTKKF